MQPVPDPAHVTVLSSPTAFLAAVMLQGQGSAMTSFGPPLQLTLLGGPILLNSKHM